MDFQNIISMNAYNVGVSLCPGFFRNARMSLTNNTMSHPIKPLPKISAKVPGIAESLARAIGL
jgi:hypothetical protein